MHTAVRFCPLGRAFDVVWRLLEKGIGLEEQKNKVRSKTSVRAAQTAPSQEQGPRLRCEQVGEVNRSRPAAPEQAPRYNPA